MQNGSRQIVQDALEAWRREDPLGGPFVAALQDALEKNELDGLTTPEEREAIAGLVGAPVQAPGEHAHFDTSQIIRAGWDPVPRWLRCTGLPQVLGGNAVTILELLLRTSMMLGKRDDEAQNALFGTPTIETRYAKTRLAEQAGVSVRTAYNALQELERCGLLTVTMHGYQSREGRTVLFRANINLELLEQIYVLTCNEIPADMGGLQDRNLKNAPRVVLYLGMGPTQAIPREYFASLTPWQSPPIELLEALLHGGAAFKEVVAMKTAAVALDRRCVELLQRRASGESVSVDGIVEELNALHWKPVELVATVEKLVER